MKKNKYTIFFLLLLSVGIWCTVAYRIYATLKDDNNASTPIAKIVKKVKKDTVSLLLNYRDPFLGGYMPEKLNKVEKKVIKTPKKETITTPTADISPDFQYKGIIRMGKSIQILLNRNGESTMLKPKEKVGEFVVSEVTEEKLVVTRNGKKYNLLRQ